MPRVSHPTPRAGAVPRDPRFAMIAGLLFVACLVLLASRVAAADLTGTPHVIDGDTIDIGGERVRLHGIDAPERSQTCSVTGVATPCGRESAGVLQALTDAGPVRCSGGKRDRYGRLIAVCYAGDRDLNAELVRRGWALAYRRYSMDYVGEESDARAHGRGMWRGAFIEPWAWRRGERLPTVARGDGNAS